MTRGGWAGLLGHVAGHDCSEGDDLHADDQGGRQASEGTANKWNSSVFALKGFPSEEVAWRGVEGQRARKHGED